MKRSTVLFVTSILFLSCDTNSDISNPAARVPVLHTTAVDSVTHTLAIGGGNISSDGGSAISARGVCWSTEQDPGIADSKTIDGFGTGGYKSNISGLYGGRTYYVRAYATNGAGTGYGASISFTTSVNPEIPKDMAFVHAGSFRMGAMAGDSAYSNELPVRKVTFTRHLLVGRTEITQAQWAAVMGNYPSNFKGDSRPVEQVRWSDAVEYCNRRSARAY